MNQLADWGGEVVGMTPGCDCEFCRAYDPFPSPPPAVRIGRHPTLLEIAHRQDEVDKWDERAERARRRFRLLTVAAPVAFLANGYIWDNTTTVLVGIVTTLFGLGLIWFACRHLSLRRDMLNHLGPRPEALTIRPFTGQENSYLVETQEPEPFRAMCGCPGCGEVAVHRISPPGPKWADAIRTCGVCQREWAQGK